MLLSLNKSNAVLITPWKIKDEDIVVFVYFGLSLNLPRPLFLGFSSSLTYSVPRVPRISHYLESLNIDVHLLPKTA